MSLAYLNILPFVVLNLGGEMIFILDQRLRAQDIGSDRSQKVLQDVIKTMLSKKFVEELFRPQEMYSMTSTRQIFEKLAHSSIMKLNATSMNKLFDLMLMGVKYQTLSCTSPDEIYNVTMTHMQAIADLIKGSSVEILVNDTINQFKSLSQNFKAYDYMIVRQQMYKFFQDKHIKVSLFIQDGIQGLDGTIYLNFAGEGAIFGEKPGSVKFFDSNKNVTREKQINLLHSSLWKANPNKKRLGSTTQPHLGTNMYAADRVKPPIPLKLDEKEDKTVEELKQQKEKIDSKKSTVYNDEQMSKLKSDSVMNEFNSLADLIGPSADSKDEFKLNLFPESVDTDGGSSRADNIINIDLGKQGKSEAIKKVMKDFEQIDLKEANQSNTGDELLDLMDNL